MASNPHMKYADVIMFVDWLKKQEKEQRSINRSIVSGGVPFNLKYRKLNLKYQRKCKDILNEISAMYGLMNLLGEEDIMEVNQLTKIQLRQEMDYITWMEDLAEENLEGLEYLV